MKKILVLLIAMFCGVLFQASEVSAQRAGQLVLSAGSGASNMHNWMEVRRAFDFERIIGSSLDGTAKYSGIPPLWVNGDYALADDLSLGLSISYQQQVASFTNALVYNGDKDILTTEDVRWVGTRLNIGIRPMYVFSDDDKLEGYLGLRVAYKMTTSSHNASASEAISGDILKPSSPAGLSPLLGFRVFFTELVGLNFELQLGQPYWFATGLNFRL